MGIRKQLLKIFKARRLLASSCFSAAFIFTPTAQANPTGGVVAAGSAAITSSGTKLDVHQHTNKAVIDWRGFDIGANEHTQFYQPGASSIALNRVHSTQASKIDGKLTANGNVVLVNQNGVMFGKGAQVDVNGLVATTADTDNSEFMNSNKPRFNKPGNANASVVNAGTITAKQAGLVGLVAPNVSNSGVIKAKLGRVQLSSGDTATVDFYGDGLLEVAVSDNARSQLVSNTGRIEADGGTIALTAAKGKHIVDSLITVKGSMQARSVGNTSGKILVAGNKKTEVHIAANIDVSGKGAGQRGGAAHIVGDKIALMKETTIDASGTIGGGEILVGGDYRGGTYRGMLAKPTNAFAWGNTPGGYSAINSKDALFFANFYAGVEFSGIVPTASRVFVEQGANVFANAITQGNGGRVIFWSDNGTAYYGNTNVRGGIVSGNGGFVEVSGKDWLSFAGTVDAGALHGVTGTLLLDPADITISNAADSVITAASPFQSTGGATSNLNVTTLQNALGLANVTITSAAGAGGNGDITFIDPVVWNSIQSLTVTASRHINVNNTITNGGTGDIILNAFIAANGNITINSAITTDGSISATAGRDLTVAANLTTGSAGGLSLQAANGVTTGTGNLNITGNLTTGSGNLTLISGVNGARPSWTATATNLIPSAGTFGVVNIAGFQDLTIDRNMTSSGNITLRSFRDLNIAAGRTVTTGAAGSLDLRAANGNVAGTGNLNLTGNIGVGSGSLTLISGNNGGRPNWTATAATLIHAGNFGGAIDMQGFGDLIINRALALNANLNLSMSNNTRTLTNSGMSVLGTGTMTFNNPLVIQEAASVAFTSGSGNISFAGTIDGTAGGAAETLTINSGTGNTIFNGALNGFNLAGTAAAFNLSSTMGQTTAMGTVTLTSTGSMTLPTITSTGNLTASTTGAATDLTVNGNLTSGGNITLTGLRGLTLNAGRTITNGPTGNLTMNAANGVVANGGALTILGNLLLGTGNLTLISGTARPNLTLNATNLALQGASLGIINITGFNDLTIDRDLTSTGNITLNAYRDLTLNAARTITNGAGSQLTMNAANGVTTGTGNLNLNGNLAPGSSNITLRSGINGTRPSWTMTNANFAPQSTFGVIDIQGFLDLTIDRVLNTTNSITMMSYRDLTINPGMPITTGAAGGLILQAAGNVVTGTGNLNLNGNVLSVGTGALTMTSGANGVRPSWTITAANLIRQGATFGAINISGFLDTVIDRDMNSSGAIAFNSFRDLTLNATRTLTTGAAGGLSLQAANTSTAGTGNLVLNGNMVVGTGTTTMRSGINGTRPSWTMNGTNFTSVGANFGPIDIQGFLNFTVDRDITSTGGMTMVAFRDLTLPATRTLTTGATNGLNLQAANGAVAGTGNLNLLGNLSNGTGNLTLISGINGTRPSWTATATNLIRQGATFGVINIQGFLDFIIDRDMNSTGNITMYAHRDLTLNATRTVTPGAAGALDMRAANGVVAGVGNLNLNGDLRPGTGTVTLRTGANGVRPSWVIGTSNFVPQTTFGAMDIQGFYDIIIDRDFTSSGSLTFVAFRDLTLNAGRTLTTGAAGALSLQAANGSAAGTGRLNINGNLSSGTGALTLISGINGTRPTLTLNSTNLVRQGATFGALNIQGFANIGVDRVMNSSGTISFTNHTLITLGDNMSSVGTLTLGNPVVIGEGESVTLTSTGNMAFSSTINGTAGGVAENLTTNSGAAVTTFSGAVGGTTPLGNLTVNADSLTVTGTLAGTGTLTLAPNTAGRAINIGTASADTLATSFNLSNNEMGRLVNGWGSIVIGNLTSGDFTNTRATFSDAITLLSGNDFFNNTGVTSADPILVRAVRDVTLNQDLVTTDTTTSALIVAAGRNFINNRAATALQVGAGGRWLVYSTNPTDTTGEQSLSNNFNRYSCTYGGSCPALGTGNGLLYSYTPTLDVTIDPQTYNYGDAVITPTGYTLQTSGYLNALDLAEGIVGGTGIFATTYVQGDNAGTSYSIVDAGSTFTSNLGYGFNFISPTGNVGTRAITVRAANQSRIYGFGSLGTTGFTISSGSLYGTDTIDSVILTTDATLSTGGEYNYRATPWQISASGANFSSGLASNYAVTYADAPVGLTIARRAITLASITALDKIYDGLVGATVTGSTFDAAVAGDLISMSGLTGDFNNPNVGARTVTVTGGTFGGADSNNYSFTLGSASVGAAITARPLTITALSKIMTYGAGNTFNGFSSSGLQNGETIGSVTFGTNATTSTSGNWNYSAAPWVITASAATGGTFDINNYSVTYVDGALTVNRRALAVTASGIDKIYNGLTNASVTFGDDRVAGDLFTASGTATFADANVAPGKTVTVTGIGIAGTDANNYTHNAGTTTTAAITPRALTITANNHAFIYGAGNTYNGFGSSGLQNGETIGSVSYSTNATTSTSGHWNARGTPWAINVSNATGGTFDINNYNVTYVAGNLNIARRALTIASFSAADKPEDGNMLASILGYSFSGNMGGDALSVAGLTGLFDGPGIGLHSVSLNTGTLAGADAGNYNFTLGGATALAFITDPLATLPSEIPNTVEYVSQVPTMFIYTDREYDNDNNLNRGDVLYFTSPNVSCDENGSPAEQEACRATVSI